MYSKNGLFESITVSGVAYGNPARSQKVHTDCLALSSWSRTDFKSVAMVYVLSLKLMTHNARRFRCDIAGISHRIQA